MPVYVGIVCGAARSSQVADGSIRWVQGQVNRNQLRFRQCADTDPGASGGVQLPAGNQPTTSMATSTVEPSLSRLTFPFAASRTVTKFATSTVAPL